MSEAIAKILLEKKAVSFRIDPPFTGTSGIKLPLYVDNRVLISYPKERSQIVNGFVDLIKSQGITCQAVAATATSGIPWGMAIASTLQVPLIYVRGSKKEHGRQNLIEGVLEKGNKYLVVEDTINTGKSSRHTIDTVKQAGGEVTHLVAIYSHELSAAADMFQEVGVKACTLSGFTELINVAHHNEFITENEKNICLNWKNDPQGWNP